MTNTQSIQQPRRDGRVLAKSNRLSMHGPTDETVNFGRQ